MTPATGKQPRLFHALMYVAACDLQMRGVITARIGYATARIPPGTGHVSCVIYWWDDSSNPGAALYARTSPERAYPSQSLFGPTWSTTRWMQFLEVSDDATEGLRRHFPEVPNLGQMYEPSDDFMDNDSVCLLYTSDAADE